ncbi:MAG TPA: radical SAM protein [Candidatus Hydrogenedens sp.]|nr:radical SAM protein [Candidatus Hydrogenedens sp.]HPP58689.1 radical SAM protein [Candidatus Hydrogenedens sp.]
MWYLLPSKIRSIVKAWVNPPVFPTILQIEPTNRCNLKCIICSHGYNKITEFYDLSLPVFNKIVDEIYQFKYLKGVHIQGLGEPILYPKLIDAIQFCKERNLETYFNSNFTILSDETAEMLVKIQHDRIAVSIDTIDPDLYLCIRPGSKNHSLSRVLNNIKKLDEFKKKNKSDKPVIAIHAVIFKSTVSQIPEMIKVFKEHGANMLCFQHLIVCGIPNTIKFPDGTKIVDNTIVDLPDKEKEEILTFIRSLSSPDFEVVPPHDLDFYDETLPPRKGIVTCFDLWEKPTISANGDFMPCCYTLSYRQFYMGNIYESDFKSIWFSDRYKDLRWQHVSGNLNPVCATCSQLYQVFQPSTKLLFEGKIDKFNYYPNVFLGTQKYSFY